ncbi:hypothetical protein EMIT047CA2_180059 [Pseudomonas soli]
MPSSTIHSKTPPTPLLLPSISLNSDTLTQRGQIYFSYSNFDTPSSQHSTPHRYLKASPSLWHAKVEIRVEK